MIGPPISAMIAVTRPLFHLAPVSLRILLALALPARIYGTYQCHFRNIDETSSEYALLKEQPYMAISCGANRGQRAII
jgi:hypothetical protein